MTKQKTGIRPKAGDTVVIVTRDEAYDAKVTRVGTKYFYVKGTVNELKFRVGGAEGHSIEGWHASLSYVYSSRAAYDEWSMRGVLLRKLTDMTHNCNVYGDIKNHCSTENIRQAIALLSTRSEI